MCSSNGVRMFRVLHTRFGSLINLLSSTSAFLAIGAATLADIYEPHERGTKVSL